MDRTALRNQLTRHAHQKPARRRASWLRRHAWNIVDAAVAAPAIAELAAKAWHALGSWLW